MLARSYAAQAARRFSTSQPLRASTNTSFLTNHTTVTLAAGAAGGFVAYGLWYLSPAGQASRQINSAAYTTKKYYDTAAKTLQAKTPTTDQALDGLKQYARSYFSWVPGGGAAVDAAFRDIDSIREKHGDEVDALVKETYGKLQKVAKAGLSMDAANQLVEALDEFRQRLLSLAGGSFNDILDNHPQLREKVGKPVQDLQKLGDSMGPEVKKQVDQTWEQIRDILKGGVSTVSIYKIKNLLQEKSEQIKTAGGESWTKALEQAKPLLDKNPQIKKLIDDNASALKGGNVKEIFEKVSEAVKSGKTDEIQKYVTDYVKSSSGGAFEHFAKLIPGGDQILPRLSQIKDVAEKHRHEGEELLKETVAEIRKVVESKSEKAQSILDKAGKEAKQ